MEECRKRLLKGVGLLALLACVLAGPAALAASESVRQHPYLYFTAKDVPALRERIRREPFASRWKVFMANADRYLSVPPPVPQRAMSASRNSLGVAGTTAFAYVMTGDRRYGMRAKIELLSLVQATKWNTGYSWNRGADLSTAELGVTFALVWDWCYDLFSRPEREAVREAVVRMAITPYLQSVEQYHDWWVDNPVTNWCGVVHGGCGLAGLALYDESPEARRAADHAWDGLQKFLRSVILKDGAGHEGVMYWLYGVKFGNYYMTAASHVRGDDAGLFATYSQKLAGYWDVYMQGPDERYANFNDMGEHTFAGLYSRNHRATEGGPNGPVCALFEALTPGGDDLLLWAADNGGATFYWAGASPFWFLWRRDAPPAGPRPTLQDVVLFRGAGHAIFSSPTLWFVLNGGWVSDKSHSNLDLGTFVLVANGERFVNDPGYGITATADHSTILVNGRGQRRGVSAVTKRFGRGERFAWFASDLSSCYPDTDLTRWVRHAVMVDGSYIVLLDDLAAATPAEFEWHLVTRRQCQADQASATALLKGTDTDLYVIAAAPQGAVVQASTVAMHGTRYRRNATMQKVTVRPPAATLQTAILSVLYPVASGSPPPAVTAGPGGILKVLDGDRQDTILFEQTGSGWTLRSVNGESAAGVPDGSERALVPFRTGGP